MDADVDQARFDELLVKRVHQLLVIQTVRMLGQMLVGIIADGMVLEWVRLQFLDGLVYLIQPAGLSWRKNRVREGALRAGLLVDLRARLILHLVSEEPIE